MVDAVDVPDGDGENRSRPERLAMLASALAGRTVATADGVPGEPSWTDGVTIFLDPEALPAAQLESLVVQASLLAGGALEPTIMRRLSRRPALTRRYLAVEGRRALASNAALLPPAVRPFLARHRSHPEIATPAESLAVAAESRSIADPPPSFGAIRVQALLKHAEHSAHGSRLPRVSTSQMNDSAALDPDPSNTGADPLSSPVGAGGAIGKLLGRLTSGVRRIGGGGEPNGGGQGLHTGRVNGAGGVVATAATRTRSGAAPGDGQSGELRYPEWDLHRAGYKANWCTVIEQEPAQESHSMLAPPPETHQLRRALIRLGVGLQRCGRQRQGDDIDIDAAIESRVQVLAGAAADQDVYVDFLRRKRELAVLLLLDVSGSAKEPGSGGRPVHEHQCATAAVLAQTLHELGDRVALYTFCSQGRSSVYVTPLKRFDEHMGGNVLGRLGALVPGGYSRLGAAIRHGAAVMTDTAGSSRRLLVVITDGLAYDHGYERDYGAADARRALAEARREGIGCLCLTVGAGTDTAELRRVFGSTAHASIPGVGDLSSVLGPLFRSALGSADLRNRISRRPKAGANA
ncbi:VWA domain-containing protein [Mycobacterium sp. OTB74]|jgi:Mg-chelatase subunit ChlD|uniref:nitric oxide reductase activation protein NorD n=1 Tax=Mycobacterium sp. OTB74 TaxID=1853452 RepID=UPI002476EDB9|nr:VWA domain-containing protein [Mycobacterium sp. OTB74]MDH6242754.1 nitric oxide reductase NorD protein [Mycobacterium sp. OTB74]